MIINSWRYLIGIPMMFVEALIFGPGSILQTALMYGFFFGAIDWFNDRNTPRGTG
tara:strand:+ start:1376 stop:1540 length:165 start_codon:yes stop_codon:yes gene_type:complete